MVQLSLEHRAWGPVRLSNELQHRGYQITAWDVRQVWDLHDLCKHAQRVRASERSQATWRAMAQGAPEARKSKASSLRDLLVLVTLCGAITVAALRILTVLN